MLRSNFENASNKETIMNRLAVRTIVVWSVSIAILTGSAGLKWAATAEPRQGPAFIAGDRAVTEDEVRSKLQDDGWSNIQIARDGDYFGISGVKNGQSGKLAIDSRTGRLRANDDDDDD
jgi:hypothetical protein